MNNSLTNDMMALVIKTASGIWMWNGIRELFKPDPFPCFKPDPFPCLTPFLASGVKEILKFRYYFYG
ncbi:MAG: hypothetical protein WDA24_09575 [Tissierellales bacterium]